MTVTPRLLNYPCTALLPNTLFSDLQLDKILSTQAIAVLQHPCGPKEIVRRHELFVLLDQDEPYARMEKALSVLLATERALPLLMDTKIPLDKYHRYAEVLASYINACEGLASMHDLGGLLADVSDYYSSDEKKSLLANMKESAHKIKKWLQNMNTGFLSFSDKHWLTPDCGAISEFDGVSACAAHLGLAIPQKKLKNTRINPSLSDAVCRLYANEVAQIEREMAKYADIDFYEPTAYIPEIKFFLEMQDLRRRATKIGVPHCISRIASIPQYVAKDLCDVSLLAKNCENIVPNDADFTEQEPFCFLLGANGGGKTTYLRALGINLILFLAGCPVFAREADIYPFDVVLSHFPKDERFDNSGRLDEEKKRTEDMLKEAQSKAAFLFFNETFSGTDDKRGFDLLTDTAAKMRENNHFGLYVTHFHEVITLEYPVLSSEVDLADANKRTFRIVKAKGSASSYAADILKKYRLDKESLAARRCGNGH